MRELRGGYLMGERKVFNCDNPGCKKDLHVGDKAIEITIKKVTIKDTYTSVDKFMKDTLLCLSCHDAVKSLEPHLDDEPDIYKPTDGTPLGEEV
jgi:hypothetical protein